MQIVLTIIFFFVAWRTFKWVVRWATLMMIGAQYNKEKAAKKAEAEAIYNALFPANERLNLGSTKRR